MVKIVQFIPRSEYDAKRNLIEFIDLCKSKLTVFGEDLKWASPKWKGAITFTKTGTKSNGWTEGDVLHESFIDFAKAYLRYQQSHRPTNTKTSKDKTSEILSPQNPN